MHSHEAMLNKPEPKPFDPQHQPFGCLHPTYSRRPTKQKDFQLMHVLRDLPYIIAHVRQDTMPIARTRLMIHTRYYGAPTSGNSTSPDMPGGSTDGNLSSNHAST